MPNRNHPWIQDYSSFEAVLCSINDVGQWEHAAILRAFQTYGFDDASTSGSEDLTFRHIDTGVLLLSDGDVIAVQFGDGKLQPALSDLFLVLNALGWKEAEVYHPAETLGALLNDMGKAIPGHLDFDVRPAEHVSDPGNFPEADALKESAKNLMQGIKGGARGAQEFHALALQEVALMDPNQQDHHGAAVIPAAPVAMPVASTAMLGDQLDDELPAEMSFNSVAAAGVATRPYGQRLFLEDDTAPVVPVLSQQQAAVGSVPKNMGEEVSQVDYTLPDAEDLAYLDPQAQFEDMAHAQSEAVQAEVQAEVQAYELAPQQASQPDPARTLRQPGDSVFLGHSEPAQVSVRPLLVGQSALIFDRPETTVTLEDIERLADQIGAVEVVHAWPGLVGQTHRWDLIGEVDPASPWFAEVLARDLDVYRNADRIWFAAMLLQLARHRDSAQLRDLLEQLCGEKTVEAQFPMKRHGPHADERRDHFEDAVLDRFAGLLLSQEGESFLDVRPPTQSEKVECVELRAFTVRSMLYAQKPMLYVIHLDAADGQFVETIVNLLEEVAMRYSNSTRAQLQTRSVQQETERRVANERETERQEAVKVVQATMAGLIEHLKKAGLPMPAQLGL